MKAFYADIVRDGRFTLLAGPFSDEATARKYEIKALQAACKIDALVSFDDYGVVSMSIEDATFPGELNHLIDIDPADLLLSPEELEKARQMVAERRAAIDALDVKLQPKEGA